MEEIEVDIYALCEEDGTVRYVGKSKNLKKRFGQHKNDKSSRRLGRWIRSLKLENKEPKLIILETVESSKWQECEIKWIKYYRNLGNDLVNHTDGGEGLNNPTEETRKKMSIIKKDLWSKNREKYLKALRSKERNEKISKALSGKPKTKEHIAKLPQMQKGFKCKPWVAEMRRKYLRSASYIRLKGTVSDEEKRKTSIRMKGNQYTKGRVMPEHEKLQRSLSNLGKKRSQITKDKIRKAAIARWKRIKLEK